MDEQKIKIEVMLTPREYYALYDYALEHNADSLAHAIRMLIKEHLIKEEGG